MYPRIAVFAESESIVGGRLILALLEAGVHISAVLIDRKASNRRDLAIHQDRTGGRLSPIEVREACGDKVATYVVADHNAEECVTLVRQLDIDWVVNGGTPRILKHKILTAPRFGVLNCHPGLLPAFRGSSAVEWALFLNEPLGNTVHLMNESIDEGPILSSASIRVEPGDLYQDVRVKIFQEGFGLMAITCRRIVSGQLRLSDALPQGRGRYFKPIDQASFDLAKQRLKDGNYSGMMPLGREIVLPPRIYE